MSCIFRSTAVAILLVHILTAWGTCDDDFFPPYVAPPVPRDPKIEERMREIRANFHSFIDRKDRRHTAEALREIATEESRPGGDQHVKMLAISSLPDYSRLPDTIQFLISELEFRCDYHGRHDPLGGFPAAKALVQIGGPARSWVLGETEGELSKVRLRLIAHILAQIDGGREIASFRVQREIDILLLSRYSSTTLESAERRRKHERNLRELLIILAEHDFDTRAISPWSRNAADKPPK